MLHQTPIQLLCFPPHYCHHVTKCSAVFDTSSYILYNFFSQYVLSITIYVDI